MSKKLDKNAGVALETQEAARLHVKRKRKLKLEKAKEARRLARKLGPAPGATRVVENKKRKAPKHKKDLLLEGDV